MLDMRLENLEIGNWSFNVRNGRPQLKIPLPKAWRRHRDLKTLIRKPGDVIAHWKLQFLMSGDDIFKLKLLIQPPGIVIGIREPVSR
jgi:hypothetical protein